MKGILAFLLMAGALVGVWYWLANAFKKKGSGVITRHIAGALVGVFALVIAGIFSAAVGLIEPEKKQSNDVAASPGSRQDAAQLDGDTSAESGGAAQDATEVATTESPQDEDVSSLYHVIADKYLGDKKRSVDVELDNRVTRDQLAAIAEMIRADRTHDTERTFISYRLAEQQGGWGVLGNDSL